jgi:YD repeat-containing protein
MKCGRLLVAAVVLHVCGCSCLIAKSGKDLSYIKTRAQVHAEFGRPDQTAEDGEGAFDSYHTRRKIAEHARSMGMGMGIAFTYGLGELIAFPAELVRLGYTSVVGQELRFQYDPSGRITSVLLDGERTVDYRRVDDLPPEAFPPESGDATNPLSITRYEALLRNER